MKKLLVFLSIFGVLFVSTIRPLHAEFIEDDFTLVNGTTYYFIIPIDFIEDDLLIAANQSNDVSFIYFFTEPQTSFKVHLTHSGQTTQYYDIPLVYLGEIDTYISSQATISSCYVYSFVWSAPTISTYLYDDVNFAFDTENPLPPISIYDTIYSLVNKYVFGNNIESGSHQDLTATILSTTVCVLVFALPFLIIWKVIKIIMG